ncbi:MAG: ATP-binding cassette domain-containing protein [Spirochaetes bacterium]|nr:ATP-binding cassette domain-containing protein [Spirochaetota bacterium]
MFFRLIDIKKQFADKDSEVNALDGINLDINEKNFISLVGPSGAGKSTLLLLLAGLVRPTSGDIYFDSMKLTKLPDREWSRIRRENIGIIFQKKIVINHLRVHENLLAPLSLFDYDHRSISFHDRIEELMEKFDLFDLRNRYPRELSGGELQRLVVARSLVTRPKILLADEPTGDLDLDASMKLLEVIKGLNKEGLTIVMVTHNKKLANIAKNIYLLNEGNIQKILK